MEKFHKIFQSFCGAHVQRALPGRAWKCSVCVDLAGGGLRSFDYLEWFYDGILPDPYGDGESKYCAFQPVKTASGL